MEPAATVRRRSGIGFASLCPRLLVAWLNSPCGLELREAIERECLPDLHERLFNGSHESKELQAEVLERAGKETRCVVVVQPNENGTVSIDAYGPRELLVKIITLPKVPPESELLRLCEQLVEAELPRTFRATYRESKVMERAILEPYCFDFEKWTENERRKIADREFLSAIKSVNTGATT